MIDRDRQIVEPTKAAEKQPRHMICYKLTILLLLKKYTRDIVKHGENNCDFTSKRTTTNYKVDIILAKGIN